MIIYFFFNLYSAYIFNYKNNLLIVLTMNHTKKTITSYHKYYPHNLKIKEPRFNTEDSCYISSIKYNNNRLLLQTPRMRVIDIIYSSDRFVIVTEFPKKYPEFYKNMVQTDNYIINEILTNGNNWFNCHDKLDKYIIENLYSSIIKIPDALKTSPKLYITIPIISGIFNCKIYNKHEQTVPLSEITVNDTIIAILALDSLAFYPEKYFLNWNAFQIKTFRKQTISEKYLFEDDSDENIDVVGIDSDFDN